MVLKEDLHKFPNKTPWNVQDHWYCIHYYSESFVEWKKKQQRGSVKEENYKKENYWLKQKEKNERKITKNL